MRRLALLSLCAACGGEPASTDITSPLPEPVEVQLEPSVEAEVETGAFPGRILGFDAGQPVFETALGLVRGLGASETPLEFVALENDDEAPTSVRSVVTSEEGAWLAAENGLFALEERFVLAVDPEARPDWVTASGGALGGLWWVGGDTLHRWTADQSDALDLSAFGAGQALRFTADFGLLRIGASIFELDQEDGYRLRDLTPDVAPLGPFAGHGGDWWVAVEGGLLRKAAGREAPWRRYEVEGRVLDLASGADGALWVQTEQALLRMEAPFERAFVRSDRAAEGLVQAPDGTIARVVEEGLQVWVDTSRPAVTFEDDVLPWLGDNGCIGCHSVSPGDYSDFAVFSSVAAEALSRVRSGDMPRCGAGPCPPEQQLTPDEYEVLEAWIAGGRIP